MFIPVEGYMKDRRIYEGLLERQLLRQEEEEGTIPSIPSFYTEHS